MPSSTKAAVLQQHADNKLLNALQPPLMMRGPHDLSADDFQSPLDERMIDSTITALEAGQTHYVEVPGIPPLREALAAHLNATTKANYAPDNLLVTAGMQEARFLTIQLIGQEFERIALPTVIHPGARKALGVRPMPIDTITVDPDNGLLPTPNGVRTVLEAGSRLIYLESPSRLTGATFTAAAVAEIAELIASYDASVIWDQGLSAWLPADTYTSLTAQTDAANRTAAIGEAWPGMGLASWFIGYIAAPTDWIPPMQSQKQIMAICTSTPSQYAALEASQIFAEAHPTHLQTLTQQRAALVDLAAGAKLEPLTGGAATVFAARALADKAQISAKLSEAGYTVADGADFGAPDVLRFTVTMSGAAQNALKHL
ncbi:MAG: aminotransferase class I/II-fold pyridoxal phosphate-dependent enzyme, partial [Chloroflexi bacterium]|nr:aminotransferase class I/II-fold pyridoxal phosphate-dependent enzyme [Chloroflexota bacterium]